MMVTLHDVDILARTLFGEARGEYGRSEGGLSALIAVANVVMNRMSEKSWYGATIAAVCLKPWQFSCWNRADPNYVIIKERIIDHPIFTICQGVAEAVAAGQWPDITKGSNHYHTAEMVRPPDWAREQDPILRIGRHLFYRLPGNRSS